MKQILDIPVIYDAEVIFKGTRKQRTVQMYEILPFEVNTINDGHAPVVAELEYGSRDRRNITLREINGKLSRLHTRNWKDDLKLSDEHQEEYGKYSKSTVICDIRQNSNGHLTKDFAISLIESEFKEIISDTRQKAIADMRKLTDGMTLIGDELYHTMDFRPEIIIENSRLSTNMNTCQYLPGKNMPSMQKHKAIFPIYGLKPLRDNMKHFQNTSQMTCKINDMSYFLGFNMSDTYQSIVHSVANSMLSFMKNHPKSRLFHVSEKRREICQKELLSMLNMETYTLEDINWLKDVINECIGSKLMNRFNVLGDDCIFIHDNMIKSLQDIEKIHLSLTPVENNQMTYK